jgi:V/A-type H+/Na+-transporting ATPase subunit K
MNPLFPLLETPQKPLGAHQNGHRKRSHRHRRGSGIGTAIAQYAIGAAAVGATAEDEKNFGKGLTLTVIPETIVLFGFVIAFMLMGEMT